MELSVRRFLRKCIWAESWTRRRKQAWKDLLVSGPVMCVTPLVLRSDKKLQWLEPGRQCADGRRGGRRRSESHLWACKELGVSSEGGRLECGSDMLWFMFSEGDSGCCVQNGLDRDKTAVEMTIRRTLRTPGEGRGWMGPELQQCAKVRGGLDGACWS